MPPRSRSCTSRARLTAHGGYRLLDTQFVTDHLVSLGAVEIAPARLSRLLEQCVASAAATSFAWPRQTAVSGGEALDALSAA